MARAVFKLFGMIGMKGLEKVDKDLKEVDKQAKKLARSLTKTGRNISKMGASLSGKLTAPIVALAGGLTLLAKKTGDYADTMLDLEQITGLSVENLQKMELVAAEAGVSFEGFVGVIGKFQSRLPQIIEGTGRASETMEALGVNVKDSQGNLKDMNTLFPEMIRSLQGVDDVTERNAMAMQLFGRSMSDLAPILGMAAGDLERIGKEAEDMGVILDRDALNAANNFRVSLEKLQAQFTGVFRVIATKFMPILNDTVIPLIKNTVIPVLLAFGDAVGTVLNWFNSFSPEAKKFAVVMLGIVATIGPALLIFGKIVIAMKALIPVLILAKKAMILLNVAMAANPIGAVIILVIGLVTAITLLYNNNERFRKRFLETWDTIVFQVQLSVAVLKMSFFTLLHSALTMVEGIAAVIPSLGASIDSAKKSLMELSGETRKAMMTKAILREVVLEEIAANEKLAASLDDTDATLTKLMKAQQATIKLKKQTIKLDEEESAAAEALANDKAMFEDMWTSRLQDSILNRKQLLQVEYEDALSLADKLGADRNEIELFYAIERLKIAEDEELRKRALDAETAQIRKDQAKFARDQTINSIADMFNVISQFYDMRIQRIDATAQSEIAAVNESVRSQEEKAEAIGVIEEKSAKKIRELKRKQAISDKAHAIFGIIIATAQAIMTAFAQLGPIGGAIAGAIIGGIGIAQIAVVAARPVPLAKGGLVKRTPGGVNTIIGEGKEDEIVLPLESGVMQLADALQNKFREVGASGIGIPEGATFGGTSGETHYHIGTLIANDEGVKQLERRLRPFTTRENQRQGALS